MGKLVDDEYKLVKELNSVGYQFGFMDNLKRPRDQSYEGLFVDSLLLDVLFTYLGMFEGLYGWFKREFGLKEEQVNSSSVVFLKHEKEAIFKFETRNKLLGCVEKQKCRSKIITAPEFQTLTELFRISDFSTLKNFIYHYKENDFVKPLLVQVESSPQYQNKLLSMRLDPENVSTLCGNEYTLGLLIGYDGRLLSNNFIFFPPPPIPFLLSRKSNGSSIVVLTDSLNYFLYSTYRHFNCVVYGYSDDCKIDDYDWQNLKYSKVYILLVEHSGIDKKQLIDNALKAYHNLIQHNCQVEIKFISYFFDHALGNQGMGLRKIPLMLSKPELDFLLRFDNQGKDLLSLCHSQEGGNSHSPVIATAKGLRHHLVIVGDASRRFKRCFALSLLYSVWTGRRAFSGCKPQRQSSNVLLISDEDCGDDLDFMYKVFCNREKSQFPSKPPAVQLVGGKHKLLDEICSKTESLDLVIVDIDFGNYLYESQAIEELLLRLNCKQTIFITNHPLALSLSAESHFSTIRLEGVEKNIFSAQGQLPSGKKLKCRMKIVDKTGYERFFRIPKRRNKTAVMQTLTKQERMKLVWNAWHEISQNNRPSNIAQFISEKTGIKENTVKKYLRELNLTNRRSAGDSRLW